MLTFILIGGLVWLAVALVFVLALAAAARKQVSPVAVNPAEPGELANPKSASGVSIQSSAQEHPTHVQESVAT